MYEFLNVKLINAAYTCVPRKLVKLCSIWVHPVVFTETLELGDNVVDTADPVDDNPEIQRQLERSQQIGISRSTKTVLCMSQE